MACRWHRGMAAGLTVILSAGVCAAQSALPPVYVQIGPALSVHHEGEQYHRASPALKGASLGGALSVGARFAPQVAVEAAVTVDGKLSDAQSDVYNTRTDYTAESRDIVIDVNLRFRPRRAPRLEFTAGGGWAYTRFARRDVVYTVLFPPRTGRSADTETSAWEPTLNGTMAVAIPLLPRVELVPAVGVRWIRRGTDTEAWYLGVGRYTVLASAAIRLRS